MEKFNARVYTSQDVNDLRSEMELIGSEYAGIRKMTRKAVHFVVKVEGVRNPAVLILKEEMLAKGGDCAIHKEAITARVDRSSCLLMGTEKQFRQMFVDLRDQPFDLKVLAEEIQRAIERYQSPAPLTPSDDKLPDRLRPFYSALRERTLVMGILNITPDSFSDGGIHNETATAVEHGIKMVEDSADVIDIGGESSRPGAAAVSVEEELSRVIPVIRELTARTDALISIDTYKPTVARAALDAGASIINDITGLADEEMRKLAAERCMPTIIMHMQGTPQTMQTNPVYEDLISDILAFLRKRIGAAVEAGLPEEFIIIDPGIGFGKTAEHNLEIIRNLADFKSLGLPILLGTSRKAFIGKALGGLPVTERVEGTAVTLAIGIANGASIIRVHDVKKMAQVARMADAIQRNG